MSHGRFSILISSFILFTTGFCSPANAKSIYAITDHGYGNGYGADAKISAYGISSDHITYQSTLQLDDSNYPTGMGRGPVGLAIDSNSGYLFVTHEDPYSTPHIQIIDATTLTDFGWIYAEDATDLCGIVFDKDKNKLYTVDRGYNRLFVYSWNPTTKTLTLDGGAAKTLPNLYDTDGYGAGGIALDEVDDILYVTKLEIGGHSAVSSKVYCYSTSNWTLQEIIDVNVNGNHRNAVGIAVYHSGNTKYLYTGTYNLGGGGNYLVRTDLNSPHVFSEKNLGTAANGITVDPSTGYVYVTTFSNELRVYSNSNWSSGPYTDTETEGISGPAGIVVGNSYESHGPVHNITEDINYPTIQLAVNAAESNDVLVCDPCTYNEHVVLGSKKLTIRSTNPADRNIASSTIVQPPSGYAGFTMSSNGGSTINGFTIRHGTPGVSCTSSTAKIFNCIIDSNTSGGNGISVSGGSAVVKACEMSIPNGSGIYAPSAADVNVASCILDGSTSGYEGIYIFGGNLVAQNCRIKDCAYTGIYTDNMTSAKIYGNCISGCGSTSYIRAGIYVGNPYYPVEVFDNVLYANYRGIYVATNGSGTIAVRNNTVAYNSYGLYLDDSTSAARTTASNSIIWGNTAAQLYNATGASITYCDVQGGYGNPTTTHNISSDPCFVNSAAHDYHLKAQSLCKDACGSFNPLSAEKDIDGDPRKLGMAVDIGADEFRLVDLYYYAAFANAWMTHPGDAKWSGRWDLFKDTSSAIDFKDLKVFTDNWLLPPAWEPGYGVGMVAEGIKGPQQSAIWLVADNNNPDPNTDVTIYVCSQVSLASMGVGASVAGDANITTAMSTADCNQYGWDPQYSADPNIDPNGTVYINGATAGADSNAVVGYFKFRYTAGQVNVAITANSVVYDDNNQPVIFSTAPLTIAHIPNPPPLYLVSDGNMTPDPNTEVTVYVHTDVPLYSMTVYATVSGDANITTAMSTADCNQYGWEPEWSGDPYIDDVNGIVGISGGKWGTVDANTIVGYFKFMYHSGQVNVALTTDSIAYDANDQPVTYSTDPLIFGGESMQQQMMMQSSSSFQLESSSVVDVNSLVNWLENLWNTDAEVRAAITEAQWQQFLDAVESNQ